MIITKNKKVLHKELNMIFKIFKQEDGEEIIFVEDNTLYFASNCIAGRVRIRNFNGENMLQIESGIYQLKQLPRKDFILDLLHFEEKNVLFCNHHTTYFLIMQTNIRNVCSL